VLRSLIRILHASLVQIDTEMTKKYSNQRYAVDMQSFDVEWYHDLEIWVTGHSRSFKMVPFESLGAVSYSPSIVTMALSCICSEIKPDIGRKLWFFHTPLHSAPPLGGFPLEYRHPVWYGKTRMVWLPDGKKILKICLFILTWSTNVTDGRTDRQTDGHRMTA